MANRLEINIVKDIDGKKPSPESMSIQAVKSLEGFLKSLREIAELQSDPSKIKISVTKGSVSAQLQAPEQQFKEIENTFLQVINSESDNKEYAKAYREIQKIIKANSLNYDFFLVKKNKKESFIKEFKSRKEFRAYSKVQKKSSTILEFLNGELKDVGGNRPNFHLEIDGKTLKINCGEREAQKMGSFLYKPIYVSVWKTKSKQPYYELCDFYPTKKLV